MSFRYFRPRSLSWWSGIAALALGVLSATGWPQGAMSDAGASGAWTTLIAVTAALLGSDATPASLILTGLAIIGIRDKLERVNSIQGTVTLEMGDDAFFEEDVPDLGGNVPDLGGGRKARRDSDPGLREPRDPWLDR